ncbi:KR domain-containing protein [Purpureocillium lavendulum]|uniref:KR domain-containing protein n=1 Tax=Purpureocillium lavendulum TaxID=1247861 RepID=A0AB34FR85_9HYPO|nr:KR domain-containing protein [Purpureocillium lavendulum]
MDEHDASPPIAVIGMGMRLPGGITTAHDFWSLLVGKKDGRCRVPSSRYNVDAFYGDKTHQQNVATDYGYFLDVDIKGFDTSFFGVRRAELDVTDPQLRLLLEVVWECFENAGQANFRGTNTGVFVGTFGEDWHNMLHKDSLMRSTYRVLSAGDYALSNMLSWEYDLSGPSIILDPAMTLDMSEAGVLSPTGSCKTFDAASDGFARGEAVNAVLLKPLDDAIRDGDPVKPNLGHGEGAAALTSIIKAILSLENETIPPNINFINPNPKIPFQDYKLEVPVEPVPWPENRPARISVSSFGIGGANGHVILDSAASFGICRNAATETREIGSAELQRPLQISDSSSDESSEKASLSETSIESFDGPLNHEGMKSCCKTSKRDDGAHTSAAALDACINDLTQQSTFLFPISAGSETSLESRVDGLRQYLQARPESTRDVAFTLGTRREHLPHRTFCVARPGSSIPLDFGSLGKASNMASNDSTIVFVFTGQGAQWPDMGRSLMESLPGFLEDIQDMDRQLQQLDLVPEWTIEGLLRGTDARKEGLNDAQLAQPLCTAVQIGLVNFLRLCGVTPSAVVGHSSGEIAAAYAAGSLSKTEAITCAYLRGLAVKSHGRVGGMAAVGKGKRAVLPFLVAGAEIACENSPSSVTISGDLDAVDKSLEAITGNEPETFTRRLDVNVAYHSYHMHEVGAIYEGSLKAHLSPKHPLCPFYSTVTERYFYDRVQSQGLRYGPRFQLLKDISADVGSHAAIATVRNDEGSYEAAYAIHPTTIDCCLQLGAVANCQGIARNLSGLVLPVAIENIRICSGSRDLTVEATVEPRANTAEVRAVMEESNRTVLEIKNGRFLPFNTGDSEGEIRGLIRRSNTRRDIFIASERLAAACILQLFQVIQSLEVSPSGHLAKYAAWAEQERDLIARRQRDDIVPESQRWISMDEESLQGLLDNLMEDVHAFDNSAASGVATMMRRLVLRERIEPILRQTSNPLESYLEDGGMKSLYDFGQQKVDIDPFIYSCAHANPTLKVLEIGAGTASASEAVLQSLTSEGGTRMYSQYVFTDLSSGFFSLAQDRLRQWGAIDYKVLDIEKDPSEQGFEPGSFDLIVASNVLHATRSLHSSLKHVRSLLRPGGRLYLQELVAPMNGRLVNLLTGVLPGWWIGQDDNRDGVPCVSMARWDEELRNAGFSGTGSVTTDDDGTFCICAHITSRALEPEVQKHTVCFLYKDEKHDFALSLASEFEQSGISVHWTKLWDANELVGGLDVISTIDLEGPYFANISQQDFTAFTSYLSSLKSGLLWLTRSAQVGCVDPRYGIVTGLARTIRPEIGVDFWTAELDCLDLENTAPVAAIYRKFHARPKLDPESNLDTEYAVKDNVVHIGRYHWTSTGKELQSQLSSNPKQLIIGRLGLIGSMHWVQQLPSEVQDEEVEVEIRCVGLNFKIYATVGTEEKVQYLIDNHGIPRERIFHSRDASFREGIMKATGGRGVDMVLNSLSGDLLHASWQCVAKYGKMMEIGKRDMLEHGHLELDLFEGNRSFYGIDLRGLWFEMPANLLRLLDQLSRLGMEQQLKPIRPIHTFPIEEIPDAFRFMKKGQHIGKIVIQLPQNTESIPALLTHEPDLLSSTSTYLLVGGLGGLGKEVTRWMVEKGARSFCFLSRSADDPEKHGAFFSELKSQGCRITAVAGSVVEMADVKRAIAASPTLISGVVQMSMVLRDYSLLQMSYDDWRAAQDPKVQGTWNLHEALAGTALDFFILFGSVVGVAGQPGQGNYAAANSFLDSFMHYRHGLGLPCSVIDLGGMEGIGFLTTRPDKMNQYRNSGLYFLQEEQLMEALRIAIRRSSPADGLRPSGKRLALTAMSQLAVGMRSKKALSDPRNTIIFSRDIRFGLYINMNPVDHLDTVSRDEEMREFLKDVEENPDLLNKPDTLQRISMEIGRTLFKFLALPEEDLDIGMTLESIGVDSLVSIEIRNWWRRSIGLEITVLEILNAGTIEGLGKLAIASLGEKYKWPRRFAYLQILKETVCFAKKKRNRFRVSILPFEYSVEVDQSSAAEEFSKFHEMWCRRKIDLGIDAEGETPYVISIDHSVDHLTNDAKEFT